MSYREHECQALAGGTRKLPRIAESAEEVLYQFDEDADGRLEVDEFRQSQTSAARHVMCYILNPRY